MLNFKMVMKYPKEEVLYIVGKRATAQDSHTDLRVIGFDRRGECSLEVDWMFICIVLISYQ